MKDAIQERMTKFYSKGDRQVTVNATTGHFATSQSHVNYYIDVTRLKIRIAEAEGAAKSLCDILRYKVTTVDTIVCMDDALILGAFLAKEMEKSDFRMNNLHETMYVVSPIQNSAQQLMFPPSEMLAIEGKNILILTSTTSTGNTIEQAVRVINYYGGTVAGVASIFSTLDKVGEHNVYSLFHSDDFPDYNTYFPHQCPMCEKKIPIEAIVSGNGYSLIR